MTASSVEALLLPVKKKLIHALKAHLGAMNLPVRLKEAIAYTLLSEGKRVRPAIVFFVAEALKKGYEVTDAALAIELCHNASLIVDDLPCMDDEAQRRGQPTLHKQFGETTALLVSYGLVNSSYGCLLRNRRSLVHQGMTEVQSEQICTLAIEIVAENVGFQGAVSGQYEDLLGSKATIEEIEAILYKKTVTLFVVAFSLGWLYGGGEPTQLPLLHQAAKSFGMAFQICDDCLDRENDALNNAKPNLILKTGLRSSEERFFALLDHYESSLNSLRIDSDNLILFSTLLRQQWELALCSR